MNRYKDENIKYVTSMICSARYLDKCKLKKTDFIRKRKMGPIEITHYLINKKGLSTKMEIENFNDIVDIKNISSPAVLKQREKFNPDAITYLIDGSLELFYGSYKDEVKTYKGYILTGIDGSDFEIPNRKNTREKYNGNMPNGCARITVSTLFDLLNHYTIDTIIKEYNADEILMGKEHLKKAKSMIKSYPIIRIMDRNYRSLSDIYHSIKNDNKFIVRIAKNVYKEETNAMKSKDEIIVIKDEYNRTKYYKQTDRELYEYLSSGKNIKVRCVKITLPTGEIEQILTNLEKEQFSSEEIKELYRLRWKIETNYHYLKTSLKIESITSGKEILIRQEILSGIMVFNILQSFINDSDEEIEQENYKNVMKTNVNMAVGILKKVLIYILIEEDHVKRSEMINKFYSKIQKYVVPIKPNRTVERKGNPKNKFHINKRKTF